MHSALFVQLLFALVCILLVTFLVGKWFARIGQPVVVGEMIAGIIIGPTVLGSLVPGMSSVFTEVVTSQLSSISGIGLAIFMFLVGMEMSEFKREQIKQSATLTLSGFIPPFICGFLIAFVLFHQHAGESISVFKFGVFMGVAMAMTSIPMLARMMKDDVAVDKRIAGITLMAASLDDVLAWCILSVVLAMVKSNSWMDGLLTTVYGLIFVAIMFGAVKPLMAKIGQRVEKYQTLKYEDMFLIVLLILLGCMAAEWIGISSVFGCFLLGMVMPKTPVFQREVAGKLQDITSALLLPIYFAISGLKINLMGIMGQGLLWTALLIIGISIVGKYVGSMLALRSIGFEWRKASAIGGLMNAKGLMGLIVADVGLTYGIIDAQLFMILILMSVVTTSLAMPIYKLSMSRKSFAPKKALVYTKERGDLKKLN